MDEFVFLVQEKAGGGGGGGGGGGEVALQGRNLVFREV